MEVMGLKVIPVTERCLLRYSSMLVSIYGWHFWNPQLVQTVLTEGLTCLQLPTRPSHLLTPIRYHQRYYSNFEKSCSEFSSVSQLAAITIKCQLKDCSSYTLYLAWLQSSTRELQQLEYFKLVFLKIPNGITCSVFQNQFTSFLYQPVFRGV